MKKPFFKRVVVVVIDGLGAGELPDAARYGDSGSDTLDNTARAVGGLALENLSSMGLGCIEGVDLIEKPSSPIASYGRMAEASPGKDTSTGHWEMAGVILKKPFATFPDGFPPEMLEKFSALTGYGALWAKPASGTEIIERFGKVHIESHRLIIYTSADSVFQIAAHEDIVPLKELYGVCREARGFLNEYNIERVIARPFTGPPGAFTRTAGRRDFSMGPPAKTLLERVRERGVHVTGIGKIGDIFAHRGIDDELHTTSDSDGLDKTVEAVKSPREGPAFIFTNLVEFDMLYGHRNDPRGCAGVLKNIDKRIPGITALLTEDDLFIITGDHGCDPTTPSTDHSREYAPLIVYGKGLRGGVNLGTRKTFADLGASIAEAFAIPPLGEGQSFLPSVLK